MKSDKFLVDGEVIKCERGTLFRVVLDDTEHEVLANVADKLRLHHISILAGDRVQVELDAYDLSKGTIRYRYKD